MDHATAADKVIWAPERRPWGRADALALAAWTAAIVLFFWDAVTLRKALFYFDITEINYPYRDFVAREFRAGRFSRWLPDLYCGLPLYSESQAGYLHPSKLLYLVPGLPVWAAFNLDTILSIWLAGAGTYLWLRRHVGPSGALAGAGVFGLSGYVWAHFIHTSMINALASVPFAFWALEWAWQTGRLRGVACGALALAFQVFAGHLQDAILTSLALIVYGAYRAATERGAGARRFVVGSTLGTVALAVALSAVQWVPSWEFVRRSPRAEGLSWGEMTYGSWGPELLPTLLVREAYGTRARDTDWMDGFYPYHEMNAYLGVVGLGLAVVGAAAYRDRWVGAWLVLGGLGLLLMLGRYTFLMDQLHRVPGIGSGRVPARYHLWVSLSAAALAAVGVDRLSRPSPVRLRWAAATVLGLAAVSAPILAYAYAPVWAQPDRWTLKSHRDRYRWLGEELAEATARTAVLAGAAWIVAAACRRSARPARRRRLAALLPALAIADLLGAHARDVPTIDPAYWTDPPASADRLRSDPGRIRIFGTAAFHSGEPGFASMPGRVDFLAVRDTLAWSLPPVWGLASTGGETPMVPTRWLRYTDGLGVEHLDVEGLSHILRGAGGPTRFGLPVKVGSAFIYSNPGALPRARLLGRPRYARDESEALEICQQFGADLRERIVVEDPDRLLAEGASVEGTARIVREVPERVEVVTDSEGPAYLFLADAFDPGWSATLDDGRPAPIRPAQVAFRAVFVPPGRHRVIFRYRPAGFGFGLAVTVAGLLLSLPMLLWPRPVGRPSPEHGDSGWPVSWPRRGLVVALAIVALSAVGLGRGGPTYHPRWRGSFHRFTWGAGIEAMRPKTAPNGS